MSVVYCTVGTGTRGTNEKLIFILEALETVAKVKQDTKNRPIQKEFDMVLLLDKFKA